MPTEFEPDALVKSNVTGSHNRSVIVVGSYNNVSLASQPGLCLSRPHKLSRRASTVAQQLIAFERRTKFVGREVDFDALTDWLNGPRLITVRTLIGPPGIGKTRLAIELVDRAEAQGWSSGFLRGNELQRFVGAPGLADWIWDRPTLVVVDYAAQKADALGVLLEHLQDIELSEDERDLQKLRLLLLERDAALRSGWWARAFGPNGQSDRRIDLAEPQVPCLVPSLPDRMTLALIAETVGLVDRDARLSPKAVLDALTRTEESRRILGNPLFVQIATLSSAQKGPTNLAFSTEGLLVEIVTRERQLMWEKWRRAKLPEAIFSSLENLVAIITLIQGATLEDLHKAVQSIPKLSNLLAFVSPERIIEALSSVLLFDDLDGYRAFEPDIIGDRLIVESALDADSVLAAFDIDPVSLRPRLWRLLEEYQHDVRLCERIASWVRRIIDHLAENTLGLDVFVSDAPDKISGITAELCAEVRSKITEGLRQGRSDQESLLLRKDQRAHLIGVSIARQGKALALSGNHAEAIERYDAAVVELKEKNVDSSKLLWVTLHCLRAESLQALNRKEERLAALDEAIAGCQQLIEIGNFNEGAFATDDVKIIVESFQVGIAGERLLRRVLLFGEPDIRLKLAALILERGSQGGVSRAAVLDALAHLNRLASGNVHSHLCDDADFFRESAMKCEHEYKERSSKELWKAHHYFEEAAKRFLSDLLSYNLGLRQLVLSSEPEAQSKLGMAQARGAFYTLMELLKQGVILQPRHFLTMSVILGWVVPTAPDLLVLAVRLNEADRPLAKSDLFRQIADQICTLGSDLGFLTQTDFRSDLFAAIDRMVP